MLTFYKAKQAFGEIRTMHLRDQPTKDPIAWDMALGLHATVNELEQRLARIEANQEKILRALAQRK